MYTRKSNNFTIKLLLKHIPFSHIHFIFVKFCHTAIIIMIWSLLLFILAHTYGHTQKKTIQLRRCCTKAPKQIFHILLQCTLVQTIRTFFNLYTNLLCTVCTKYSEESFFFLYHLLKVRANDHRSKERKNVLKFKVFCCCCCHKTQCKPMCTCKNASANRELLLSSLLVCCLLMLLCNNEIIMIWLIFFILIEVIKSSCFLLVRCVMFLHYFTRNGGKCFVLSKEFNFCSDVFFLKYK